MFVVSCFFKLQSKSDFQLWKLVQNYEVDFFTIGFVEKSMPVRA